ncbi:MAG: hypothetical protein WBB33_03370 [Candidatus Saccharimonadales bacterium]
MFGIGTNQSDDLNCAERDLSAARKGLENAKRLLNRTPRSENGQATRAVHEWEQRVRGAEAAVSSAKARMR